MRLLITGGGGQLGTELRRQLRTGGSALGELPGIFKNAVVHSPEIGVLDICDGSAVRTYIKDIRPDIVFHCAAMTNVDGCEDTCEQANLVNGAAVKYIAESCESTGAKLVVMSTDYVFSGNAQTPYAIDAQCAPQTAYGRSKRLGELNALASCSRAFIIRTSWLYGFHGKNFVKTILRKAGSMDTLQVVCDQYGNPTNAEDLAHHMFMLADTERYGIYHCTGNGVCSWYEFAKAIVHYAGLSCHINPCASEEYPQKAKRPAYSALDHSALREAVGDYMRPWKEALKDYLNRLEEIS